MTAADYGPKVGVPRILNLMDEYGLKASFFIPGFHRRAVPGPREGDPGQGPRGCRPRLHAPEARGAHTGRGDRRPWTGASRLWKRPQGKRITGYRVPGGEASNHSMSLLAERGIIYDSSLMDDDAPYMIETSNGNVLQIPFHWLLDDFPYYAYAPVAGLRGPGCSPASVARTWIAEFDGLYQEGRCMILVMHPQVTGHPGHLAGLETTIKHIAHQAQRRHYHRRCHRRAVAG